MECCDQAMVKCNECRANIKTNAVEEHSCFMTRYIIKKLEAARNLEAARPQQHNSKNKQSQSLQKEEAKSNPSKNIQVSSDSGLST